MILAIPQEKLFQQLCRQLKAFFLLSQDEIFTLKKGVEVALERCAVCFGGTSNKYYWQIDERQVRQVYFNPYHSGQYTIFLYYLSHSICKWGGGKLLYIK